MGILIPQMELPSSCEECRFGKRRPKEYHCYVTKESIPQKKWFVARADKCPLKEAIKYGQDME